MAQVSVIIPTYNRADIVGDAIRSVLNQTVQDVEIIVVDDGSTDHTRQAVDAFADGRVQYFRKANSGPAGARNFGIDKAQGQFLAFLDSDDWWPDSYVACALEKFRQNPQFGAVYSPVTVVFADGRQIKSYKRPAGKEGFITADLFSSGFIWPSAAVFRADLWNNFCFDESLGRSSEDSDAFLRLSLKTQFGFIPDVEAFHRISADSLAVSEGLNPNRLLSLERFYFQLGGQTVVPRSVASKKLSHSCRKMAKEFCRKGKRRAALKLYARAIQYRPFNIGLFFGYLRAARLDKVRDPEPLWEMPRAASETVKTNWSVDECR